MASPAPLPESITHDPQPVHHNSSLRDAFLSNVEGLSSTQVEVAAALARGRTVTAAAEAAGVHRTTVHNWLRTCKPFRAAFDGARAEHREALFDRLQDLSTSALDTLRDLLAAPETPANVRLRAAAFILERPDWPQEGWKLPADILSPQERKILEELALMKVETRYMEAGERQRRRKAAEQPAEEPAEEQPAPSRSGPCPCGSGLKYKRCCGPRHGPGPES